MSAMSTERQFVHSVDPSNWLTCHNLKLFPYLSSPDFMARKDRGLAAVHQSLRQISVEDLQKGSRPPGVVTPRTALKIITGAVINSGGHVGQDGQWLTAEQERYIHDIWKIELDFEMRRREIAPEAASRLCCLWLAEDSQPGRKNIQLMLGPDKPILTVMIVECGRLTRVDTTWFDKYCESRDRAFMDAYWNGSAFDSKAPRWEFLLEGTILFDQKEIAELYALASQLPSMPVELTAIIKARHPSH